MPGAVLKENVLMPDRFEMIRHIASGGMAEVFLCRQKGSEGFSKLVAIKKILHQFSADERFLRMFTREAKLAAMLNHNNICKVYDFVKYGDEYLLIMEYISGITLRDLIEKLQQGMKRIPIQVTLGIIQNIAKALNYIHSLKDRQGKPLELVHRDVTPSNIMLSDKGEVKLMDFGIAKIEGLPTGSTSTGEIKGKIGYLSPEQVEGLQIDQRSDIFSMGVIFYELLSSKRLFVGESQYTVLYKIKQADIVPISDVIPYIDSDLEAIVMRCLARNREDRYSDAKQLIADLNDYALHKGYYFSEENLGELIQSVYKQEEITAEETLINPAVDFEIPDTFESVSRTEDHLDFVEEIRNIERKSHRIKYAFIALFSVILLSFFYLLFLDKGKFLNLVSVFTNSILSEPAEDKKQEMLFEFVVKESEELDIPEDFKKRENEEFYLIDNTDSDGISVDSAEFRIREKGKDKYALLCRISVLNGEIAIYPEGSAILEVIDGINYITFNSDYMILETFLGSDPEGVSVFREGSSMGTTPVEIEFEHGSSMALVLKKEGYKDKNITVKREDIIKGFNHTVKLDKVPVTGRLAIKSDYRVNVVINRRNYGAVVGEKHFDLNPGRYNIRLTGENVFYHFEQSISVKENETFRIETQKPGFLDITATPSKCRVYLNGILLDQEPPIMNMKIASGRYRITVHWEQFDQKREDSFEIFQGERKTLPMFALN